MFQNMHFAMDFGLFWREATFFEKERWISVGGKSINM